MKPMPFDDPFTTLNLLDVLKLGKRRIIKLRRRRYQPTDDREMKSLLARLKIAQVNSLTV